MKNWFKSRFDFWTVAVAFICVVVATIIVANLLTGSHDTPIEEAVEDVIHHHTGMQVDLSWDSPETGHLP